MSDSIKKSEDQTLPAKQEPVVAPAEPKVTVSPGLFKDFTLGSHLKQSSAGGNIMTGTKKSPMDYEKAYQSSSKNQQLTAEQLKESLTPKK